MELKLSKFAAARVRHFNATGMAVQKALPFERPRMISFRWTPSNLGIGGGANMKRGRRRSGERVSA